MGTPSSDGTDLEKQERVEYKRQNAPGLSRTTSRAESHAVDDENWAAGHDLITPIASRRPDEGDDEEEANGSDKDNGHTKGADDEYENDGESMQRQSTVNRVLSRIASRVSVDPGPPPDGGFRAWSQCVVCHLVIFNTWGWANSFGTFQAYYTHLLDRSPSEVSWIGSLNVFLLFFIGAFTGRLTDAGYFRVLFLTGSVLLTLGMFTTAVCTSYWQFLLAQGLCTGLGHGCLFCPTLAVLSTYFHKRRALALGIAACGSATGGLVFPSMVRQLLPQVGFAWTVRAIAFVQVAVLIVCNVVVKTRIRPRKAGPLLEPSAFKELEYTFYAAGAFFNFWGVYFAFFYLAAFSRDALHPPLSYTDSLNLLLILNGVGIVGRLIPNYFADRVGPINIFIPTSITASILMYCFIAIKNPPGLYAWSVIYGIVAAGIQSLFPAALSSLTTDLRKLGVRMGMVFTMVSFAVLTGPPVAGAIVDSKAGYKGAKAFAGSSIAVGCAFLCAAKITKMRKTGQGWTDKV